MRNPFSTRRLKAFSVLEALVSILVLAAGMTTVVVGLKYMEASSKSARKTLSLGLAFRAQTNYILNTPASNLLNSLRDIYELNDNAFSTSTPTEVNGFLFELPSPSGATSNYGVWQTRGLGGQQVIPFRPVVLVRMFDSNNNGVSNPDNAATAAFTVRVDELATDGVTWVPFNEVVLTKSFE